MMYCLQTVKQVPASFTKKRLLLLRIISTFDAILLAGLYGEDIREASWGFFLPLPPSLYPKAGGLWSDGLFTPRALLALNRPSLPFGDLKCILPLV